MTHSVGFFNATREHRKWADLGRNPKDSPKTREDRADANTGGRKTSGSRKEQYHVADR